MKMTMNTKNKTPRTSGFTLVEIMITVAIIGLLAAIAIPNFVRARGNSQASGCLNNLRQIDAAIQQWALENNAAGSARVTSNNLRPYLDRGARGSIRNIYCPADISRKFTTSYVVSDVSTKPSCLVAPASHLIY